MKKLCASSLTIVLWLSVIVKMSFSASAQITGNWLSYWYAEDSLAVEMGNTPGEEKFVKE